jgi:hypothetical protein
MIDIQRLFSIAHISSLLTNIASTGHRDGFTSSYAIDLLGRNSTVSVVAELLADKEFFNFYDSLYLRYINEYC